MSQVELFQDTSKIMFSKAVNEEDDMDLDVESSRSKHSDYEKGNSSVDEFAQNPLEKNNEDDSFDFPQQTTLVQEAPVARPPATINLPPNQIVE